MGLSNMVLLDHKETDFPSPQNYDTVEDIMERFYEIRLGYYAKRKAYILEQMMIKLVFMRNKVKFIRLVNEGKIIILHRPKKEVLIDMKKYDIEAEILAKTRASQFTDEDVKDIEGKLNILEKEREDWESRTPKSLWLADIEALEKKYYQKFPKMKVKATFNVEGAEKTEVKSKNRFVIVNGEVETTSGTGTVNGAVNGTGANGVHASESSSSSSSTASTPRHSKFHISD